MELLNNIYPFFMGLGLVILLVAFIYYINRTKSSLTCSDGEGLIYNENDIGSSIGIGGYKCDICDNDTGYYVDDNGYCKKCGNNKYYDGRRCVTCPRGSYLDKDTYTCQCDNTNGYFDINGECIKCPDNKYYYNGSCIPCTNGRIINYTCRCDIGYGLFDGVCKNCNNGTINRNGECICPSGYTLSAMSGCVRNP